ncbi:SPOR domain-containing protein [Thiomicrospira microaerophila]|uniref:SPOR domain-containing protein n=1 Tax=Thiomicrospira microaerophila TaxID=406020 RepID=UPI0005CAD771|nr:SPOR domain-containing protein [Thiomicrospira microaerophila]
MAQTISELEKERAKLLEAIEAQANQLSKQRGGATNEARPHTLNDWLNAAEQVVPAKKEPKMSYDDDYSSLAKPRQHNPRIREPMFNPQDFAEPDVTLSQTAQSEAAPKMKKKSTALGAHKAKQAQKASFFGVIIMLSLLMTVLGVIYVAYNAVQRDMQQLAAIHSETLDTLGNVQLEVMALKDQIEKGGDADMFDQLIERIEIQQRQLSELRQAQASQQISPHALREATQQLERQMEARLQGFLTQMAFSDAPIPPNDIQTPATPSVPTARSEQKVVRLVEQKAPVDPDVTWLKQQAADNFVLQLASMADRNGIEQVINDKRIQGGRIIPQIRDGRQSFVLVVGSHAQRTQANQMAVDIKEQTGISPWVRRVRDLSGRVE